MAQSLTRAMTIQTSNSNGKQKNINLSNINTTATEANLKNTAHAIAELTTNNYIQTLVTEKYYLTD